MTQSISIRREGDLIVIEDREDTKDHAGVLKATYLTKDAAIHLGVALIRFVRETESQLAVNPIAPIPLASEDKDSRPAAPSPPGG